MPIPAGPAGTIVTPPVATTGQTGTTLRLVDGASTMTLRPSQPSFADPILVQSYDLGFPDIRDTTQDATGQNGMLDLTQFHGAKTVTVECTIVDTTTANRHQWLEQLTAYCHPARRPYLYVNKDSWTAERRMLLRGNKMSCVADKGGAVALKASLAWSVPSGLMESVDLTEVRIRPPQGGASGAQFPVSWGSGGTSFSPANASTITSLVNDGTATASPVYRIYGACTGPTITDSGTGLALALPNLDVPAGHYVEIDVAARTATLDGTPSNSVYRYIDWSQSTWWELPAQATTLLALSTASQDSNCELLVQYRTRWI